MGKKYVMAVTGAGLFVFAVFHMVGNLQIFLGPKAINHYAALLHSNAEILWPARIGLIVFAIAHVTAAIALTIENRAARDHPYAVKRLVAASLTSRTMIFSGLALLAFVIYHLLHLTWRVPAVNLTGEDFRTFHLPQPPLLGHEPEADTYRMMIAAFSQPVVAIGYVVGMAVLCFHLWHGIDGLAQSLGIKTHSWQQRLQVFATAAAWTLFLGYAAVPLAVLTRLVK